MYAGQFDWGGLLPNGNGEAQRSAQYGWKPYLECKSISRLYRESDTTNGLERGL